MNISCDLNFMGSISSNEESFVITVKPEYRDALTGLSEFSHAYILWWANNCATASDRQKLICEKPYVRNPNDVGVFGSRSPQRPNPIGLSIVSIIAVDMDNNRVIVPYIDTHSGTPLIDIKPYFPALDRVSTATNPEWCSHWPQSYEESAMFDWSKEFTED